MAFSYGQDARQWGYLWTMRQRRLAKRLLRKWRRRQSKRLPPVPL